MSKLFLKKWQASLHNNIIQGTKLVKGTGT